MDEKAEARVDASSSVKKFCVDCKHHKLEDNSSKRKTYEELDIPYSVFWRDKHQCHHPSFQTVNVVTGEIKTNEKECFDVRNISRICGEKAKLWEPKEEKSNE